MTITTANIPQALDAEQAVLGSMLKDGDAVSVAMEMLMPNDFFYPKHQIIFEAMTVLYGKSEPLDITILANNLRRDDYLDKIGGRLYMVELIEGVVSTSNIEQHCKIVKDKSLLRRTIQLSNEIIKSCYAQEQPIDEIINSAESGIYNVSDRHYGHGASPVSAGLADLMTWIENRTMGHDTGDIIKTGFCDLDRMVMLEKGHFVIIGARPSMGKTGLALNIAEYLTVRQKKNVSFHSIESPKNQLQIRLLSSLSGISGWRMRIKNEWNDAMWDKLTKASAILNNNDHLFIDDSTNVTPTELRSKLRRLKSKHGVDVVFVDYLQRMSTGEKKNTRIDEVTYISNQLASIAKELNVVMIALSQLSRGMGEDGKPPSLSRLRDSGALEQDADVVLLLHRADRNAELAELNVAKQRDGATGIVELRFDKELTKFQNIAKEGVPF